MANTTLTRPVVTMNLANRSISRLGLATNRVLHPLAAGHFGRQVAPLAVISNLKIVPTETGIAAETSFGNINVDQPLYSRLLGKAGVSEIDLPKGTSEDTIGATFKAITMRRLGDELMYSYFLSMKINMGEIGKMKADAKVIAAALEKSCYKERTRYDRGQSEEGYWDGDPLSSSTQFVVTIPERSPSYITETIFSCDRLITGILKYAHLGPWILKELSEQSRNAVNEHIRFELLD